jgi:hypothetical protein
MFTNDLYDSEHRLRALDILMSVKQ